MAITTGEATSRLRQALLHAYDTKQSGGSDFPFPQEYTNEYLDRRRECGLQLHEAVRVQRGDKEAGARQVRENFRLFGAPHVAVLTSDTGLGIYGAVDVGGYVQVLLLSMQAHGVAAIAQAALATQSALVKHELGIASERNMVCAVSFGYEDPTHLANGFRTNRASLDQVVQFVGS